MKMYEIEKGIPVPIDGEMRARKYPFATMEIGDSFYVGSEKTLAVVQSATYAAQKALQRSFRARREGEGTRVWRIA
jgi:hypothetical protein